MNEHLKALLEELQLSEETVTQLQTVLSEGIQAAVTAREEELNEAHTAEVATLKEAAESYGAFLRDAGNKYGDYVQDSLKESVAEYADLAVTEFIKENREKLVDTEQFNRMQAVFEQVKDVFELNGFALNTERALEESRAEREEINKSFEGSLVQLKEANDKLEAANRRIALIESTADLTDTQKEKVNELLEAVSFDSREEFDKGLTLIVEQVSKTEVSGVEVDDALVESVQDATPVVAAKVVNEKVAKWATQIK